MCAKSELGSQLHGKQQRTAPVAQAACERMRLSANTQHDEAVHGEDEDRAERSGDDGGQAREGGVES